MNGLNYIIATLRGAVKAVVFLTLVLAWIPVAVGYKYLVPGQPFRIPRIFHGILVKLIGLRVRVYGAPSKTAPVLFVANHVSYLDIPILGSILDAGFVAKSEVARWPLFGFLSRIQNTIFVERRSSQAAEQRTQLQEHLARRQNLILFPEGTSSQGLTALHFKSSLFSIVEDSTDAPITIQPVSLACIELAGRPLQPEQRDLYAWYGDMTLPPHLWNAFKNGFFTVDVVFHAPLTTNSATNRKELAATCQNMVARGIEHSLKGKPAVQQPLALPPA